MFVVNVKIQIIITWDNMFRWGGAVLDVEEDQLDNKMPLGRIITVSNKVHRLIQDKRSAKVHKPQHAFSTHGEDDFEDNM